ncbi:unnamed protein product [Malus baccata var. baccata]
MWRRLLSSSQLKTLTLAAAGSAAAPCLSAAGPARSLLHKPLPLLPSYFGTTAEAVQPVATGHEREELEAELEGRDVLEINHLVGPFGTREEPADEHDVVWFWLEKGKPHELVGPGGSPDHSDDHH